MNAEARRIKKSLYLLEYNTFLVFVPGNGEWGGVGVVQWEEELSGGSGSFGLVELVERRGRVDRRRHRLGCALSSALHFSTSIMCRRSGFERQLVERHLQAA